MTCVQIRPEDSYASNSLSVDEISDLKRVARAGVVYSIQPCEEPCFFPGMGAKIVLQFDDGRVNKDVGIIGVMHPQVLSNYDISYPCTITELDIDALLM